MIDVEYVFQNITILYSTLTYCAPKLIKYAVMSKLVIERKIKRMCVLISQQLIT